MTSGTAALAAPTSFGTQLTHSTGVIAVQTTGSVGWSSSLKTVTISNTRFFVRGGECATLYIAGYQGANTRVTNYYRYPTLTAATTARPTTSGFPSGRSTSRQRCPAVSPTF
ncbi:hypothetical protein AB0M54_39100 [Actinoplanes sp. NPDC051470]|uniref:hypothetical protein n=1 Tax=Actinoplanes sp. NPDC051470 TaxID=3157224 RepID=UPI0034232563